ncbi:MAG: hypothetical protein ACREA7_04885 [Nitrosotalea sp.]
MTPRTIMAAIMCTIVVAVMITFLYPQTSYQLQKTTSNQLSQPAGVANWLKSHPNFIGCIVGDLKTGITKEVPCSNHGLKGNGPIP